MFRKYALSPFVFAAMMAAAPAWGQVVVTPQHVSGVYKLGEKVQWQVESRGAAPATQPATAVLRLNGVGTMKQETLDLSMGKAAVDATLTEPGAVFLQVQGAAAAGAGGGGRGRGGANGRVLDGALVSPELLKPTSLRPADFDEWWAKKIEQLAAIPPNPKLEKIDSENPKADYYKITMDNIAGKHVQGQLAMPAGSAGGQAAGNAPQKYPALLQLQWAGIYALPKTNVTNRAAQGWLAMNIEPHDIPLDQPAAFYTQLNAGPLGQYYHEGNDDREKSYFLAMYLSCYRAVEYLSTRPEWDGKTLVVMGTSMGGQQSLMIAGLNNKVTAVCVLVPSSCDMTGPTNAGPGGPRAAGFPDWAAQAASKKNPKILETGQYFDPVNFASRIKVPALVSMGLYDETSPPVGVYSAFNQIQSDKKEALPLHSGHQDQNGSQRPYNVRLEQWLTALAKGQPVPPG